MLNINELVKKRDFQPETDRVPRRKMRIFQAIVTEKFPLLHGAPFEKKVSEFERKWDQDFINFSDSKKLNEKFGVGIQAWMKKPATDRHYVHRKIFDTIYKTKVRIILDENFEGERFDLKTQIEYVFDEVGLHFYSCPNKNCFFGTDRHQDLLKHQNVCKTESTFKYKQVKYEKPNNLIQIELVEEKILPVVNFQNTMFLTYDIGNRLSVDNYF